MLIGTVIAGTWLNDGKKSLEKFETLPIWWGGVSTLVTIVDVEEVVEAVVTVVRAVGDVFIESARVIEVGETMAKMLVKVE